MVQFTEIPANLRTPGVFVEIDASLAVQGPTTLAYRALHVGQMLPTGGTAVAGNLYRVTSAAQASKLWGAGSMIATIELLKRQGCRDIRALVLVAAPEGVKALQEAHPDVRCWTAAIDSHLNDVGYIIPGLGDAGDRLYGVAD